MFQALGQLGEKRAKENFPGFAGALPLFRPTDREPGTGYEHFDLQNMCLFKLLGNGGRTVEKLVRFDLSAIKATDLDILILGFNYLCYLFLFSPRH